MPTSHGHGLLLRLSVRQTLPFLYYTKPYLPIISQQQQHRNLHSSKPKESTIAENQYVGVHTEPSGAPLSVLPLSMILRSLMTASISSSRMLLPPSLRIMTALANSHNPLFNPDKNPILRYVLKNSFYVQFCAGENAAEVRRTVARLKSIGFSGVMLCYAREVMLPEKQLKGITSNNVGVETEEVIENEIKPWAQGTLQTVLLAERGDFVAVK